MTGARTRVGIIEWARRADGARAAEMRLAGALGARIGRVPDPAVKIELARRARLHGWHADLWKSVAPLLPDVDAGVDDSVGGAFDADFDVALARLEDAYRLWRSEASAIAEAPILRVLELIARDHEGFEPR